MSKKKKQEREKNRKKPSLTNGLVRIFHQKKTHIFENNQRKEYINFREIKRLCMAGVGGTRINTMVNEQFHQT